MLTYINTSSRIDAKRITKNLFEIPNMVPSYPVHQFHFRLRFSHFAYLICPRFPLKNLKITLCSTCERKRMSHRHTLTSRYERVQRWKIYYICYTLIETAQYCYITKNFNTFQNKYISLRI